MEVQSVFNCFIQLGELFFLWCGDRSRMTLALESFKRHRGFWSHNPLGTVKEVHKGVFCLCAIKSIKLKFYHHLEYWKNQVQCDMSMYKISIRRELKDLVHWKSKYVCTCANKLSITLLYSSFIVEFFGSSDTKQNAYKSWTWLFVIRIAKASSLELESTILLAFLQNNGGRWFRSAKMSIFHLHRGRKISLQGMALCTGTDQDFRKMSCQSRGMNAFWMPVSRGKAP